MAISASYVTPDQFTVTGDRTTYLKHGLRIQALQGVDGTVEGTVDTSSYSAITELTTCTIEESVLTANLATIKRGATYADPDNGTSNTAKHGHTSESDGGFIPGALISAAQLAVVDSLPIPGTGDDNKLIQVNDTEDGYELVTIQGTADEITITEAAGTKTIAIAETFTLDEADVNFDITTGHAHTGADSTAVDHGNLGSKGTNTHAQIDTFIGSKAQASGIASLDASSKVVQEPASKAQASGIASLNASSKVVEDPANATATPTASKIPIADGSGKLDTWISDADATTKGKVQLAGDIGGTAAAPKVVAITDSGATSHPITTISNSEFLAVDASGNIVTAAGTGAVPGDTVTDETSWGISPSAGVSGELSRKDHTHGTPAEPAGTPTIGAQVRSIVEGRIDLSSATELIWTAVSGLGISIWNGTAWEVVTPSSAPTLANDALDIDGNALAVDSAYDLFAEWDSATSFPIVAKKWTSPTVQGFTRYLKEGVQVHENSADGLKRRFLATIYCYNNAATVNFKDEETLRYVINYYNAKRKTVRAYNNNNADYTYSTNAWREMNGGTNQVRGYFISLGTNAIPAHCNALMVSTVNRGDYGVALNSVGEPPSVFHCKLEGTNRTTLNGNTWLTPQLGLNYLAMVERAFDGASVTYGGWPLATTVYAEIEA